MDPQKQKVIIFDSRHASSIISAALVARSSRVLKTVDIHSDKNSLKGIDLKSKDIEVVILTDEINPDGGNNIYYLTKKSKGDKRRVLQLFEELHPNAVRPLAVHYLGKYQLSDTDKERREDFKAGLVSEFRNRSISDISFFNKLLGTHQDLDLINSLLNKGKAVRNYLSSVSRKPNIPANIFLNKKSSKSKPANKNSGNKKPNDSGTLKDKSVKELRKIASDRKIVNYSRMKKDELIKKLS